MSANKKQLIITCGEPAGIGPDLCIKLAQQDLPYNWVVVADPALIRERASLLGLPVVIKDYSTSAAENSDSNFGNYIDSKIDNKGTITVLPVALNSPCVAGKPDANNAAYVLQCIDTAVELCQTQTATALVTGPVNKAVINQAGKVFTGHTEYIAGLTGVDLPVMLLATPGLRVALVTTHIPLHQVSETITQVRLESVIRILNNDLIKWFAIEKPLIHVCGLNPHAGENGHLGYEEQEVIEPVINRLNDEGMNLRGPFSADTIFINSGNKKPDVILAMYHDQGLPVLKYKGFGEAVNVTLGLPIIRTSVDHGTAFELVGTSHTDTGSLLHAMKTADEMLTTSQ